MLLFFVRFSEISLQERKLDSEAIKIPASILKKKATPKMF
jgi:hypothetical protein